MPRAWAIPTVALVLLGAAASAQEPRVYTGTLAPRTDEYVPDRVVVGFKDGVTDEEASQLVSELRQGAVVRSRALRRAFHVLAVPRGRVWQVVSALRSDPRVRWRAVGFSDIHSGPRPRPSTPAST